MADRALFRALILLALTFFTVTRASAEPPSGPVPATLSPEVRAGLSRAAGDTLLPPWQRDLMLQLAVGGGAAGARTGEGGAPASMKETAAGSTWCHWGLSGRYGQSAIYDPVRDRMLVFGGYYDDGTDHYLNDVWVLSLGDVPTWTQLAPGGLLPAARAYSSAIYDPAGDRMVVFGGYGEGSLGRYMNDLWALTLSGTPAWTRLTPAGGTPSPRWGQSAIYDPLLQRMVMFGGFDGSYCDDLWTLSLSGSPTWTLLAPGGMPPSGRCGHSAVYVPQRQRMIVFGGRNLVDLNEVWELSLSGATSWTRQLAEGRGPAARWGQAAVYDTEFDRVVVFGGYDDAGSGVAMNDVWALMLDTPRWTRLSAGSAPRPRAFHSAIYDSRRARVLVYGGYDNAGPVRALNQVWALTLAGVPSWTRISPDGAPPSEREYASAIFDPVRHRMVVFGGFFSDGTRCYLDDTWVLSLTGTPGWTRLTPTGTPPSGRWGHSAIYDAANDRMVVYGGGSAAGYCGDVWALSFAGTPAWAPIVATGAAPVARYGHSAIYDPPRNRMVVFGGNSGAYCRDVWSLSLTGAPAWTHEQPGTTQPGARAYHSSIYDPGGDRMIVFGGSDRSAFDDTWALSLAGAPAWVRLSPGGAPPDPRWSHSAVYDAARGRMVVFGGYCYDGTYHLYNDLSALSLAGSPAWTQPVVDGALPCPRLAQAAVYDPTGDQLVVFGGNHGRYSGDAWLLAWGAGALAGIPRSRTPTDDLTLSPVPNPSIGPITVSFSMARPGRVRLAVYDVDGRLVRILVDRDREAGSGTLIWNGTDDAGARTPPGMYFLSLTGPDARRTRKVILLR